MRLNGWPDVMSAPGQSRHFAGLPMTSAFALKADIHTSACLKGVNNRHLRNLQARREQVPVAWKTLQVMRPAFGELQACAGD